MEWLWLLSVLIAQIIATVGWLLVLDKVLVMSAMLLVLGAALLFPDEKALPLGILLLVVREHQEVDEDLRGELRVAVGEVAMMAREVLLVMRRVTRMVVMRHFEARE